MSDRWYCPGDALALVTGVGVVVTDPGHEALLAALFEEPLKVPSIVEALTARGWSAVPDFACTVVEGDEVRVLVRGRPRVEIAGEVLEGHGVTTWTERSWPRAEVDAVVVLAGVAESPSEEPAPSPRLPIEAGIVRASQVQWPVAEAATVGDADAPSLPAAAETVQEPAETPEPVSPSPVAPSSAVTGRAHEPLPPSPAPDSPATIIEPDEHEFDAMFGVTVPGRRPEDAAVRPIDTDLEGLEDDGTGPDEASSVPAASAPVTPRSVASEVGDHDGRTVARSSLPRRGEAAPVPPTRTGPRVTLTLSTGETYDVPGRALVGRSPRSTAATGAALPQLVVVDDPYVSGTHLEIAVGGATVLVTDVSTNGTTLTPPGGTEGVLVRDVPTDATDGAVLRLSDDLTITLTISGDAS